MKTKNAFWIVVVLAFVFFAQVLPAQAQETPPQLPPGVIASEQPVQVGWNLVYNPFVFAINVANYFGSYDRSTNGTWMTQTIWTWNNSKSKWGFWSPQLTTEENAGYAFDHDYDVVVEIGPGEGFWLHSRYNTSLPRIVGEPFVRTPESVASLPPGWSIIGGSGSPSNFNRAMSPSPVPSCVVPTGNFKALWAWDAGSAKWVFYAPMLEAIGGSAAYDFTQAKGYQDGTYWWLERAGFWVVKEDPLSQTPPVPQPQVGCYAARG